MTTEASKPDLQPNEDGPYDVVITGGRVIDPDRGHDAMADVGIIGDRIAAISDQPLAGARVLHADGLVVAPGFIDIHAHGLQVPAGWMQAHDGVTTHLELESGLLPVGQAYDQIAAEGHPINYGLGSAWTYSRAMVFNPEVGEPDGTLRFFVKAFGVTGWQNSVPTPEQLDQIIANVEQGLQEGALGVSINAGYAPGMGRKEYYRLAELAEQYGVATFTHDRYMSVLEPHSSFEALGEQIGLAAITGAHMHICHINSVAGRDLEDATNLIKQAQSRGIPVTTEAYTYGAFSTAIGAEFLRGPDWLERFGVDDYSAMEDMGKTLSKEKIEELQQSRPGEVIIFHFLDEEHKEEDQEILDRAVLYPGGAIASDAIFWANAKGEILDDDVWPIPDEYYSHPRAAGCFSRLFARWVRERGVLSLSDAVAKCTLIPTQILEASVPQMKQKGRVQVGCDADIVVFDHDTIEDKATFVNPRQTSVGFRHVVVNGTPIILDGERVADARPGRPVRRQV